MDVSSGSSPGTWRRKNERKWNWVMILVFDIGNTNTHLGLADAARVMRHANIPTASWAGGAARELVMKFVRQARFEGAALCSVVPKATPLVQRFVQEQWGW